MACHRFLLQVGRRFVRSAFRSTSPETQIDIVWFNACFIACLAERPHRWLMGRASHFDGDDLVLCF